MRQKLRRCEPCLGPSLRAWNIWLFQLIMAVSTQILKEAGERMSSLKAAVDTKAVRDRSDEVARARTHHTERV